MKALFLASRWPPSNCALTGRRQRESQRSGVSSYYGTNPITRLSPSQSHLNLIVSQRPPPSDTITLRVRTSTHKLWRDTVRSVAVDLTLWNRNCLKKMGRRLAHSHHIVANLKMYEPTRKQSSSLSKSLKSCLWLWQTQFLWHLFHQVKPSFCFP